MPTLNARITIRMEDAEKARFTEIAEAAGQKPAELIRNFVRQIIKQNPVVQDNE